MPINAVGATGDLCNLDRIWLMGLVHIVMSLQLGTQPCSQTHMQLSSQLAKSGYTLAWCALNELLDISPTRLYQGLEWIGSQTKNF